MGMSRGPTEDIGGIRRCMRVVFFGEKVSQWGFKLDCIKLCMLTDMPPHNNKNASIIFSYIKIPVTIFALCCQSMQTIKETHIHKTEWTWNNTSEKWRQSVAKYSWKLKMVYWTLKTIEHELRSLGPKLVPLLATRWLYGGTSELSSTSPNLVPLMATRCLYQGVCLSSGQLDPT